ncbi:MAG: hypothetical protein FWD59_01375 [Micrococcales bacterium]|nr:hypothetical protein [Micrococcales bacterium]
MTTLAVPLPAASRPRAGRGPGRAEINQVSQRVAFLTETLGSAAALADLLGVARSQTTRWRQGAEAPSPAVGRVLLDLDHVVARATCLWPAPVAKTWLISSNAFLSGARPVDVLRSRGSTEVIAALDAALAGAYA